MTNAAFAGFKIKIGDESTGNLLPLLHEVRHALAKLVENSEPTSIDLRGLPLAPGEEENILSILGRGEVTARLSLLGSSEVFETNYAGVWIVTHYNSDNQLIGRFIEITSMPDILRSQPQDMAAARDLLAKNLEATLFSIG